VRLSPDERRLYVPNGNTSSGRITVIDTATGRASAEIDLDGEPAGFAISPDGLRGYTVIFHEATLAVVDLSAAKLDRTVSILDYPSAIALSPDGGHAFVLVNGSSEVAIIDTQSFAMTTIKLERKASGLIGPPR
jgi:YVTN family beta-propeller protein